VLFACQAAKYHVDACMCTESYIMLADKPQGPKKKPRILPGEDVDEKSKKVGSYPR